MFRNIRNYIVYTTLYKYVFIFGLKPIHSTKCAKVVLSDVICTHQVYKKCRYIKVSLSNMSLYPKYGVYKILLEISGLKKSVVINDLSLKPMSLNPKFTVLLIAEAPPSAFLQNIIIHQMPRVSSPNFFALQKVQTFIIELIRRDGWS